MLTSRDSIDLLSLFGNYKVRYLVVGGYAVMRYADPRFTKDIDLWVATDHENAAAVFTALKAFGAPLAGLSPEDFTLQGYFYQMGMPPYRLDIMLSIPGVEFESAWNRREIADIEGIPVPFISRADLILSKKASGRPQDLLDVTNLEKDLK